jgi:hypothetical protein
MAAALDAGWTPGRSSHPIALSIARSTIRLVPTASIATGNGQFSRPTTRLGPTAKVTNSTTAVAAPLDDAIGRDALEPRLCLPGSRHDAHNDGASRTENFSRKLACL